MKKNCICYLICKQKEIVEEFKAWMSEILRSNGLEFQYVGENCIQTSQGTFKYLKLNFQAPLHDDAILIWEDWWNFKREIIQSKIKSKLGLLDRLPARVCKIRRITKPEAEFFLNKHHLQGYVTSKIKFGLFLPQKYFRLLNFEPFESELLVAVITFSGARRFRDDSVSYELIRFCSLSGLNIQGGFSKLLKNFISEVKPDSIMTYVDLDWYSGGGYNNLGFEEIDFIEPMYFKIDDEGNRTKVGKADSQVFNKGSKKLIWKKSL